MDGDTEMTLFANGECAMMITYTGQMVAQESLKDMNLGIFPILSLTGDQSYYGEFNNMISVYAGASDEQKAAAMRFLDFILSEENLTFYASKLGELVSIDGIVANHKYGELFANEIANRGITLRFLAVNHNTEYWKAEMDNMLLGFAFNGDDVDTALASFIEYLQDADIATCI
jgi:ABC-type glycerol-3-phosphate transport system substrate-binding protein